MMYKRYMVFSWAQFRNLEPFEHIDGSYDTLEEAETKIKDVMEYSFGSLIFDRVEGKVID
mgnify:CR=1 FL=1